MPTGQYTQADLDQPPQQKGQYTMADVDGPAPEQPGAVHRFLSNLGGDVWNSAKGMASLLNPPEDDTEKHIAAAGPGALVTYRVGKGYFEAVQSNIERAKAAGEEGDIPGVLLNSASAGLPLTGPFTGGIYEQAKSGDTAGASGTGVSRLLQLAAMAPERSMIPNPVRAGIETAGKIPVGEALRRSGDFLERRAPAIGKTSGAVAAAGAGTEAVLKGAPLAAPGAAAFSYGATARLMTKLASGGGKLLQTLGGRLPLNEALRQPLEGEYVVSPPVKAPAPVPVAEQVPEMRATRMLPAGARQMPPSTLDEDLPMARRAARVVLRDLRTGQMRRMYVTSEQVPGQPVPVQGAEPKAPRVAPEGAVARPDEVRATEEGQREMFREPRVEPPGEPKVATARLQQTLGGRAEVLDDQAVQEQMQEDLARQGRSAFANYMERNVPARFSKAESAARYRSAVLWDEALRQARSMPAAQAAPFLGGARILARKILSDGGLDADYFLPDNGASSYKDAVKLAERAQRRLGRK